MVDMEASMKGIGRAKNLIGQVKEVEGERNGHGEIGGRERGHGFSGVKR